MFPLALIYFFPLLVSNFLFVKFNHLRELKTIAALPEMIFDYVLMLAVMLLSFLPNMAIIKMVESSGLGKPLNWLDALRHAFTRWGSSILTMLLLMLVMFGLTLLFQVPGIIIGMGITIYAFANAAADLRLLLMLVVSGLILLPVFPVIIRMVYYVFAITVVSLRDLSGKAALDYSKRLVKGQWWRVFGFLMVLAIVQTPVNVLFLLIPRIPFAALINAVAQSVTILISTTFITLFFLDLEAIKDGVEGASGTIEL
jgi:hypothetical protein